MLINVDFRENDLYEAMMLISSRYSNIRVEKINLPLGDIIICKENVEMIMIERKTLNDLASSIKDGRYAEQSFRLNNSELHNHSIFYLLEGDIRRYVPSVYTNVTKESLLSAMTSLSYTKGFSLYRSCDVHESALWIFQTADKLSRIKEPFFYSNIQNEKSYVDVSKRTKKNNVTVDNIGSIMLVQIPEVSVASAEAIMSRYKTIDNLIETLKKDRNALNDITITNKNNKPRKLTKSCLNNVYAYLCICNDIAEC
jgi:DNA excision repair protein ERCC-4